MSDRYTIPSKGSIDWDVPLNENFQQLDIDVEHRGLDADRSNVTPVNGAKYLSTDTGDVYIADGDSWNRLGTLREDVGSDRQSVITAPNGNVQTTLLSSGDSTEISVPVADGETLTVRRWGGYTIADGDAPEGLEVQLLDDRDRVQTSANTADARDESGIAHLENTSGSLSIFKLRVMNNTGTDYTTEGVGAVFGYEVQ